MRLTRPRRVEAAVWVARGVAAVAVVLGTLMVAVLVCGSGQASGSERIVGVAATVVLVGALVWPLRRGLFVDEEGAVIRGLIWTERYPWVSLRDFGIVYTDVSHLSRFCALIPDRQMLVHPGVRVLRHTKSHSSERVVTEQNTWMPFWFGDPPEMIAERLGQLRLEADHRDDE